jgi:LPXTG-motif cell wall-anchored protein
MSSTRFIFAALIALIVVALAPVASAEPSGGHVDKPEVLSQTVEPSGATQGTQTTPQSNQLPFTGADVTLFLAVGLGAIATGTFLLRRTRSERAEG